MHGGIWCVHSAWWCIVGAINWLGANRVLRLIVITVADTIRSTVLKIIKHSQQIYAKRDLNKLFSTPIITTEKLHGRCLQHKEMLGALI